MEAITLKRMHAKQMEIMVGKCRVGYICTGRDKPINFLPKSVTRVELTEAEKIAVAKHVRQEMEKVNSQTEAESDELRNLTSADYDRNRQSTKATKETK